jgi:putative peptide zinc metalloprotease protein
MSEPLHSPLWYRVASLQPALRPHLRIARHEYRGESWYVIHDPASGRHFRFSSGAERVIGLMDGRRSLDEVWTASGQGGGDMPTQGEVLRLLSQLHGADALSCDVAPDIDELLRRQETRRSGQRLGRFANPLSIRTRLFDPDAFLTRHLHRVRPLFSRAGLVAWCAVVVAGLLAAATHAAELGNNLRDVMLAPGSLAMALLVYPFVKAVHELAHAFTVKRYGGEVHETGLLWMLLVPVPYVDASAASGFPDKRARLLVSAAGVLAEAFIASVAVLVWVAVEPGAVRATAWSIALVSGFSTLFVNGNPLLRYDGYYCLADHLEIPNLAGRANRLLASLLRGRVLGLPDAQSAVQPGAERRWLVAYGVASATYRVVVLLAIVALVARWSKAAAAIVAALVVALQYGWPAVRGLVALAADPRVQARPARPLLRGALAGIAVAALAAVPLPLTTRAQGIVWLPQAGEIRAGTDGELREWLATPGQLVEAGTALAVLDDPTVDVRLAKAEADVSASEARYLAARATDAVEAGAMLAQLERARTEWEAARERVGARTLRSPVAGRFLVARPGDAPGRFFHQGDVVGYVVAPTHGTVLAVVAQDEIGLIRDHVEGVQVRLADAAGRVQDADIVRLTPAGSFDLPSAALGRPAGGALAVSPEDPEGRRSLERVFQVELALAEPGDRLGGRAWVRFDHGREILALRAWRATRRLFLSQFDA